MDEKNAINETFEKYLKTTLTKEIFQAIADQYGDEIASKTEAIYSDALNAPVDWRTATMDIALSVLDDLLNRKYPWLSVEARKKINYAFIMTWK